MFPQVLENMSSVHGLAQAPQKGLVRSCSKWSTYYKSTLPLCAGFAHAWTVLEHISGDGQAFLEKAWWSLHFPRASGHAETQADANGSDGPSSLQTLEADLVTHAQLQNKLSLTGMSGSVILSAMHLTDLSFLHAHNPQTASVMM